MIAAITIQSKPFDEYVSLLRCLHRLFIEGLGESSNADEIRDSMDGPWEILTNEQREIVSGLAADLNSIRRGPVSSGSSRERVVNEIEPALIRSYQASNWYEMLKWLRRLAAFRKPADVGYLRGRAWSELHDDETAIIFLEHALSLEPTNSTITYAIMTSLARIDFSEALRRADQVLAAPDSSGDEIIVVAASIRFNSLSKMPKAEASSDIENLIRLLHPVIKRMQIPRAEPQMRGIFAMAVTMTNCCYQQQGDLESARDVLDEGMKMLPNDPNLRISRGMLLYGHDEEAAIQDFKVAADQRVPIVWPYFFLAHNRLVHNEYPACLELCSVALAFAAHESVRANLLEWVGICQWQLRFPSELVRATFQSAITLAPNNERIAANYGLLENVTREQSAVEPAWERQLPGAIRAFGQEESDSLLTAVG